MFGLPLPRKGKRYWGARAIYSPSNKYYIDLLPDRQSVEPSGEADPDPKARKAFFKWLDKKGLPWLRKEVKAVRLGGDSGDMLSFVDGPYRIHACPNCSYGYLYIGAQEE